MNLELLPLSFAAGLATFFSPCFGAMLPAYISTYLGQVGTTHHDVWWQRGGQGLLLGLVVSAGFLTSFAALGLIFGLIGSAIGRYLPWVAIMVGFFIITMGIVMLFNPSFTPSLGGIAGRWFRPKSGKGLGSFYGYGMVYAVCAAACTLPIFLSVMMQTFVSGGLLGGILNFLAYGLGMSLMITLFSLALAYSKGLVYKLFPHIIRILHRLSGIFMILAGGYVLYYLLIYGRYLDDLLGRLQIFT